MTPLFLFLLAAVLAGFEIYSKRHMGKGFCVDIEFDKVLAETDEPVQMTVSIVNKRRLPVLFARFSISLPLAVSVKQEGRAVIGEETVLDRPVGRVLSETFYLMPRQTLKKTYTLSLSARGRYLFSSATLTTGDFLGTSEEASAFSFFRETVAMPKRADCPAPDNAFGNFLGEISVRRFILPDPVLTAGFREYTGRESMKEISWPRTLREGRLMVKEFDHTAELSVAVILNIENADAATVEKCFSVTRSVCEWLENKGVRYSFCSNAYTANATGSWSFLEDGHGHRHLYTILEGLGRAPQQSVRCTFRELVGQAALHNDSQKGFIVITPAGDGSAQKEILLLERRLGQTVLTVPVEPGEASC